MKKTSLFIILGTILTSLVSCDEEVKPNIKTLYFKAVGWFNAQAPTLNIHCYDKNKKSLETNDFGKMMEVVKSDEYSQTNIWKFDIDTNIVKKVQFFRTRDNGTQDGNARTKILKIPNFTTYNGFEVASVDTWYDGSNFTDVSAYKYNKEEEDLDSKPLLPNLPLIDEDYPSTILVPEIKEEAGKGSKIVEDLTTTNIKNDNYRNYYEIFVGSFYDTNNDGLGDLKGVIKKLDYIKNSGFNGIWLMPIFTSPTYHKYDTTNYYEIDPKYGTMADLDELIKECHSRNIKIILDMVVNHCSDKSEIFKKSANCYEKFINNRNLEEIEQEYKDYFAFSKLEQTNDGRKFNKVPGKDFFVEENFPGGMAEWNLDSIYTKRYFEKIYKFYIDKGVDGFRLDAVRYYFINDEEKTISYLNEMSDYCKSLNPNFFLVGECWDSDPLKVSRYYKNSRIDSYFNFKASTSAGDNYIRESFYSDGELKNSYFNGIKNHEEEALNHIPSIMLDNHDMNRVGTSNIPLTKYQYAALAMHKGNIFTYYGDEIGLDGTTIPKDEGVRTYMNWSDENLGGMTLNPHYGGRHYYYNDPLNKQFNNPNSIYNFYKKVNFLRNQIPTIARGEIKDSSYCSKDDNILRLVKKYGEDEIEILMNFSKEKYGIYDYSTTKYTKVIGQLTACDNTYIGDLGNKKLSIPPLGIAIIR